jgi:hypothetical protein
MYIGNVYWVIPLTTKYTSEMYIKEINCVLHYWSAVS